VSRRVVFTFFLAGVCLAVLALRVQPEFRRFRYIVLTSPQAAQDGVVSIQLPDLARLAGSPAALIIRLRGAEQPTDVSIAIDATAVTRVHVRAGQEIRVDASTHAATGTGQRLVLNGDRSGWQVTYAEVANVYGFSHRVPRFMVVPRERPPGDRAPAWLLVLFTAAVLAMRPRPDWPNGRVGRIVFRTIAGFILLLFVLTLAANTFSPYKILLTLETFLLGCVVLYAEPVARVWQRVRPVTFRTISIVTPVLPHLTIAAIVLWSVAQFYRPATGFTSLILFGSQFELTAVPALRAVPHHVDPGSGYDGQFYAQLALDPLLRTREIATALDSAVYRGRRILLPWMAHVLGLGQPWLILQTYALLNVACWIVLGVVLLHWLPPRSVRNTFAWIACMLSEGLLASVRQSLVDGPGALLLVLGILAIEKNRHRLAMAIVALAGLARETSLIGAAILFPEKPSLKSVTIWAGQAALVAAPFVLWATYLWHLGLSTDVAGLRNFEPPIVAFVEKWDLTIRDLRIEGWGSFARFSLMALVALSTQAVVLLWMRDWRNPWWRLGFMYVGLMLIVGQAVWEGHPGAVSRVVIPMTLAFNVLLTRVRWFWPLWILGNASLLHGLEVIRVPLVSGW
jgi:hypothetical protein